MEPLGHANVINILVFVASAAAFVFFLVWLRVPELRERIERPKYRFLADVTNADVTNADDVKNVTLEGSRGGSRPVQNWDQLPQGPHRSSK